MYLDVVHVLYLGVAHVSDALGMYECSNGMYECSSGIYECSNGIYVCWLFFSNPSWSWQIRTNHVLQLLSSDPGVVKSWNSVKMTGVIYM